MAAPSEQDSTSMTQEEEDMLLAEYGTQSIYDEELGLDIASLRAVQSTYEANTFLTGTRGGAKDGAQEDGEGEGLDASEIDMTLPLPLVLAKLLGAGRASREGQGEAGSSITSTGWAGSSALSEVLLSTQRKAVSEDRQRQDSYSMDLKKLQMIRHVAGAHRKSSVTSEGGETEGERLIRGGSTVADAAVSDYETELALMRDFVNGEDISSIVKRFEGTIPPTATAGSSIVLTAGGQGSSDPDMDDLAGQLFSEVEDLEAELRQADATIESSKANRHRTGGLSSVVSIDDSDPDIQAYMDRLKCLCDEDETEEEKMLDRDDHLAPDEADDASAALLLRYEQEDTEQEGGSRSALLAITAAEIERAEVRVIEARFDVAHSEEAARRRVDAEFDLLSGRMLLEFQEAVACEQRKTQSGEFEIHNALRALEVPEVTSAQLSEMEQQDKIRDQAAEVQVRSIVAASAWSSPSEGESSKTATAVGLSALTELNAIVSKALPVEDDLTLEDLTAIGTESAAASAGGQDTTDSTRPQPSAKLAPPAIATTSKGKKKAKVSLEAMRAKQAKEARMLEQESKERTLMRLADTQSKKLDDVRLTALDQLEQERDSFFDSEEKARKSLYTGQAIAFCDIGNKETRQRDAVTQWQRHKVEQEKAMASRSVADGEVAGRKSLLSVEDVEWAELAEGGTAELRALKAKEEELEEAVQRQMAEIQKQRFRRVQEGWEQALGSNGSTESIQRLSDALTFKNQPPGSLRGGAFHNARLQDLEVEFASFLKACGPELRHESLLQQAQSKVEWIQSTKEEMTSILPALSAASAVQQQRSAALKAALVGTPPPTAEMSKKRSDLRSAIQRSKVGTPPVVGGSAPSTPIMGSKPSTPVAVSQEVHGAGSDDDDDDREKSLNAKLVRSLHPELVLAAAPRPDTAGGVPIDDPLAATIRSYNTKKMQQVAKRLQVNVEKVISIQYKELASMSVDVHTPAGEAPTPVLIAPSVQVLDLNSNLLPMVDCAAILDALPKLRTLNLCDNKLASLMGADSKSVGQSGGGNVTTLEIWRNKLSSLQPLPKLFPNVEVFKGFGNCFDSALPLAGCPRLMQVELNRNNLKDLEGMSDLPLLRSLDATSNSLDNCYGLRRNLLLEKLYLSENSIVNLPTKMPTVFLRHLFLNKNALVAIPPVRWLPFLNLLHLDENRISDLSGLSGGGGGSFQQLTALRLAFNQIADPLQFYHLGALKKLTEVTISKNPCFDNGIGADIKSTRLKVVQMCPKLREVNNEVVSQAEIGLAHQNLYWSTPLQATAALKLRRGQSLPFPTSKGCWLMGHAWDGAQSSRLINSLLRPELEAHESSCSASLQAVALNQKLERLNRQQELHSIQSKRLYQDTVNREQQQVTVLRRKALKYRASEEDEEVIRAQPLLVGGASSAEVGDRNRGESLLMAHQHLQILRTTVAAGTSDSDLSGVHSSTCVGNTAPVTVAAIPTVSVGYALKAKQYKEKKVRNWVMERLVGVVKVRRAQKLRAQLYQESTIFLRRKQEGAAFLLQAVGRGMKARGRMRKLINVRSMDDDDDDDIDIGSLGTWAAPKAGPDPLAHIGKVLASNPDALGLQFSTTGVAPLPPPNASQVIGGPGGALGSMGNGGPGRVGSAPQLGGIPASSPTTRPGSNPGLQARPPVGGVPSTPQGVRSSTYGTAGGGGGGGSGTAPSPKPSSKGGFNLSNEEQAYMSGMYQKGKKNEKAKKEQQRRDYTLGRTNQRPQ